VFFPDARGAFVPMWAGRGTRSLAGVTLETEHVRDWADELQEETMQTLLAIRLMLSSAVRDGTRDKLIRAAGDSQNHLAAEIERLRQMTAAMQSR
jgi:hypothetical protein